MKKLLLVTAIVWGAATPALATDMIRGAAYAPSYSYSWSGCYVGGTIGGAFGRSNYSGNPTGDFRTPAPVGEPSIIPNLSASTSGSFSPASAIGGGEIGCNWQLRSIVVGLEGDFNGWSISKSTRLTGPGDPENPGTTLTAATSENSRWLTTVRPRVGYAYDNWLFYATGGVAITNVALSQSVLFSASDTTMTGSGTRTLVGWTLGAGVAYAISQLWILKAEYLYVGFPSQSLSETNQAFPTFTASVSNKTDASIVRVGFDFKFGLP
jgi:outer membrane immunogenic protein